MRRSHQKKLSTVSEGLVEDCWKEERVEEAD